MEKLAVSRRIRPDWGNTAQAAMAGLGKYCTADTAGLGYIGVVEKFSSISCANIYNT